MVQLSFKPISFFTAKPSPLPTFVAFLILCIMGFYSLHSPSAVLTSHHPSHFRHVFLSSSSNSTISAYLRALTLHPHLAGTKPAFQTARYVLNHFNNLGLQTKTATFNALLAYPVRSSLSAHFSNGSTSDFRLAERGRSGPDGVVRPYHAYSPSGSVRAMAVFVNHGREEDYLALAAMGVSVAGCVALARNGGGLSRGAVVETAEKFGVAAVTRSGRVLSAGT